MASIKGTPNKDTLNGTKANDILNANDSAGDDTMKGGNGNDIYIVNSKGDKIIEDINQGIDTVKSSVNFTLGKNIENILLTGNEHIRATGNDLDNLINGNGGMNGLFGGKGNDIIKGGAGEDYLHGGSLGEDRLASSLLDEGADTLYGENGNDELIGGFGNDALYGGAGDDILSGGIGGIGGNSWSFKLDIGNDILHGDAGDDRLYGDAGDDLLFGDIGNDYLHGGLGNDHIEGGKGNDNIDGYLGNDTLKGGDGNDHITDKEGSDILYGGAGVNILQGGAEPDSYFLTAGSKNQDTIIISREETWFHFSQSSEIRFDTIHGLDKFDKIDLDSIDIMSDMGYGYMGANPFFGGYSLSDGIITLEDNNYQTININTPELKEAAFDYISTYLAPNNLDKVAALLVNVQGEHTFVIEPHFGGAITVVDIVGNVTDTVISQII